VLATRTKTEEIQGVLKDHEAAGTRQPRGREMASNLQPRGSEVAIDIEMNLHKPTQSRSCGALGQPAIKTYERAAQSATQRPQPATSGFEATANWQPSAQKASGTGQRQGEMEVTRQVKGREAAGNRQPKAAKRPATGNPTPKNLACARPSAYPHE
jgi:hypothetical protein